MKKMSTKLVYLKKILFGTFSSYIVASNGVRERWVIITDFKAFKK